MDAFVVMPDHVHAVIGIVDGRTAGGGLAETPHRGVFTGIGAGAGVATAVDVPFPPLGVMRRGNGDAAPRRCTSGDLGSIVNQFKGACTRRIRTGGASDFAWQPRFHDVVIRDARHLDNVRRYIEANPSRWKPHT